MKKIFLLLSIILIFTGIANSQTISPINYSKNSLKIAKQISQIMISKTDFNGNDMTASVETSASGIITINPVNNDTAKVELNITKLKMSNEFMGTKSYYDSEDALNSNHQASSALGGIVGSSTKLVIDKKGLIKFVEQNEKLLLLNKLKMTLPSNAIKGSFFNLFFNLNNSINVGDIWQDSMITKEERTINNYTYKSCVNGIAVIEQNSTSSTNEKIEQMGMSMFSKNQVTSVATLLVDIKTLVIKKKITTSISKGTVEVGEQSMPSSSTITTTEIVE